MTEKHSYEIIVLDLDGTLTNRDKVITPKTKQRLMELQERGKKKPSISETALQIWHAPSMREWIVFMRYGANRKQKRMRLIAPGNRNNLRKYFYKNCLTEPAF